MFISTLCPSSTFPQRLHLSHVAPAALHSLLRTIVSSPVLLTFAPFFHARLRSLLLLLILLPPALHAYFSLLLWRLLAFIYVHSYLSSIHFYLPLSPFSMSIFSSLAAYSLLHPPPRNPLLPFFPFPAPSPSPPGVRQPADAAPGGTAHSRHEHEDTVDDEGSSTPLRRPAPRRAHAAWLWAAPREEEDTREPEEADIVPMEVDLAERVYATLRGFGGVLRPSPQMTSRPPPLGAQASPRPRKPRPSSTRPACAPPRALRDPTADSAVRSRKNTAQPEEPVEESEAMDAEPAPVVGTTTKKPTRGKSAVRSSKAIAEPEDVMEASKMLPVVEPKSTRAKSAVRPPTPNPDDDMDVDTLAPAKSARRTRNVTPTPAMEESEDIPVDTPPAPSKPRRTRKPTAEPDTDDEPTAPPAIPAAPSKPRRGRKANAEPESNNEPAAPVRHARKPASSTDATTAPATKPAAPPKPADAPRPPHPQAPPIPRVDDADPLDSIPDVELVAVEAEPVLDAPPKKENEPREEREEAEMAVKVRLSRSRKVKEEVGEPDLI
ncbi:hypothetical protein DFH09DRAFT_1411926 [Mycena vulgaris]|nr:hypothetical protein DFH09DRAFT_1411926 [Mycena vulgaris]